MDTAASAESLLSLMTWALWGVVGLAGLFYFGSSYLLEILAQKHQQPRWMAWVPIVSNYLMLRLVGWERWFWAILAGYAVALLSALLPGPLKLVGALAILPTALGMLALTLAYFPKLATTRGLGVGVGLWVVVPQFVPPMIEASAPGFGVWVGLAALLAALVAFLKIVFHDGGPKQWPHPLGYALTLGGVLLVGGALHALPGYLEQDERFRNAWHAFKNEVQLELETSPFERMREEARDPEHAMAKRLPKTSPLAEPDPVEIPDTCPPGTREARGSTRDGGRAWWCETETAKGWVRDGPARTWHPNGYLATEGTYDHGRRTGTWTRYWRSGGRKAQAEFADGVQHGWMHSWNAVGEFETAVRYEDGDVAVR